MRKKMEPKVLALRRAWRERYRQSAAIDVHVRRGSSLLSAWRQTARTAT